jgi:hypothetical protein
LYENKKKNKMNLEEALEGCYPVPVIDAIAEIKNHGLTAWIQDGILLVEDEEDKPFELCKVINGEVNTKPIMEFLGY